MDFIAVVLTVAIIAGAVAIAYAMRRRPNGEDPNEPVVVATRDGELTARLIASQLEAAGVPAFVRNASSLAYFTGFPFARWEVSVRSGDLDRARELLGEEADRPDDDPGG